tara:strand:+ start:471 stop:740 length:270 start_codon:yes stop_codon:yes gene_type:complete
MVKIMEIKQPRASKEGKTYWHKLGVKFIFDDGNESIKLDSLPLPNDKGEVWMNVFEPRPRDEAGATGTWDKPNDTASTDDTEKPDEIPF